MPRRRRVSWRAGPAALALAAVTLTACTGTGDDDRPGAATVEHSSVLEPWFDAAREADEGPANIVVMGDSVSEGYGLSAHLERRWVDRLQGLLRDRSDVAGCPTGPGGWHGTTSLVPADYRAPSLPDATLSGPTTGAPGVGPGGRSVTLLPGGSITWKVEARSVDVGYRTRFAGGTLQVEIDGEVPPHGMRISTDAARGGERRTWSSRDLGPGVHTVTVRSTVPRDGWQGATVTDLTPFRGDEDRCVHVLDASRSGVSVRTITQTPGYLKDSLSLDPDLLLVPLGFNDRRADIPADQFGRSLDRLLEQVRAQGYDGPVLLVGLFLPGESSPGPSWRGYLDRMHAMTSRHEGVSFIDLSAVLPQPTEGSRYYIDALHPSADGQALIADSLLEALVPRAQAPAAPPG